MLKAKWLQQGLYLSLCILAFALPLPYIYGSLAAILMGLLWILQADFKLTFHNLKERKALWVWIAFFLLHAIGYFYSENKAQASFDLGCKLCFFLFPIIIGAGIEITEKLLEKILLFFIAGVTIAAIYCFTNAAIVYHRTGMPGAFFYNDLIGALDANAVAESWYTIFVLIILMFYKWRFYFTNRTFLKILLATFHILFLILLASKTLVVFLFIILMPLYIFRSYWKQKIPIPATIFTLLCFLGVFFLVFYTDNPVKQRFTDLTDKHSNIDWRYNLTDSTIHYNNLTLRLFLWKQAVENIQEHHLWWYGSGIGDVHLLQNKKMSEAGVKDIYNEQNRSELYNINVHNMYLETLMMLGIPGLICLLIMFFQPLFYTRYFHSSIVFILFFIVSILFMMQESALQSQDGRIYYSFFVIVFWSVYYTIRKGTINNPTAPSLP